MSDISNIFLVAYTFGHTHYISSLEESAYPNEIYCLLTEKTDFPACQIRMDSTGLSTS